MSVAQPVGQVPVGERGARVVGVGTPSVLHAERGRLRVAAAEDFRDQVQRAVNPDSASHTRARVNPGKLEGPESND